MSIGDISGASSFGTSSRTGVPLLQYSSMLNGLEASCSARLHNRQKAYIIAIAVKAHEKMLLDPFIYTLHHLVEQKNYKVVVICCMTRVRSELGVDLLIDKTFSGISNKKLEAAMISQKKNINHFLRAFRERLYEKGAELEIHISVGHRSDDILVKAAKELRPHWVVLDISFAGHENKIQAALECNLVLMKKKKDSRPLVLQVTPKNVRDLGPVDRFHSRFPEVAVNPILSPSNPSMRISSSNRISPPTNIDLASLQNGASATLSTETPLRDHDTGDTATSSTNSKTENGRPAPPALSPAQVATLLPTPLQTESTESGHPAPPALSWVHTQSRLSLRPPSSLSPTQVATKSLRAPLPASRFSYSTMEPTPPNPRNSTSGSEPATPTSSTSQTSTGKANSSISGSLSEPIPYETALAMAIHASLLPNPPKSTSRSTPASPTSSSSSQTWTGEANPGISHPMSESIPYETALAMAIKASLLSAKEEGIPVSPSTQHSSSWDAGDSHMRPSDGLVCNDIFPPMALDHSFESDSEDVPSSPLIRRGCSNHVSGPVEGAPLSSSPLPGNVSCCDEGLGNREPSDRNKAGKDEFRGSLEGEQTSSSAWEPPGCSAGAKLRLTIADIASTSGSSESRTAKSTPSPTSVLAFSSNQSFTQVASPSTQHAPSAPPLALDGPIRYPSVDTSPFHYPEVGSSDGPPPTKKKGNARKEGECIVCWDRPADAVCIPCGHLAGCLTCLTEIERDKQRCPVCRVAIQQVLKIYVV